MGRNRWVVAAAVAAASVVVLFLVWPGGDAGPGAPPAPGGGPESPADRPRAPGAEAPVPPEPGREAGDRDVAGQVRDERGEPIPGALVRALRTTHHRSPPVEILRTATAANGGYVLGPIEGYVTLEASAPGRFAERRQGRPGLRLDFTLGAAAVLRGRVLLAEDGSPAAGALVVARREAVDRQGPHADLPPYGARTDRDGRYRFESLFPGFYTVRAQPTDGPPVAKLDPVRVGAGEEAVVDLLVPPGAAILGVVRDEAGAPIAGARVWLGEAGDLRAETDAEGRYRLPGLRAGTGLQPPSVGVHLIVRADGYATSSDLLRKAPAGGDVRHDFVLEAEGSMSGRVIDDADAPVPGAEVKVYFRMSWESTLSGADGSFRLGGLRFGHHQVFVRKDGMVPMRAARVTVQPGEETTGVVFTLHRGGEIAGRVEDEAGNPVDGARVGHEWTGEVTTAGGDDLGIQLPQTTGPDGSFRFRGVRHGPFRISATAPGFLPSLSEPATLNLRERRDGVLLVLRPGAEVRGRVTERDGTPVPGARVSVYVQVEDRSDPRHDEAQLGMTLTDEDGRFRVGGLLEGPCCITVYHGSRRAERTGWWTGMEGLVLVLDPLPVLRGRTAVAGTGDAPAGFWLSVGRGGGGMVRYFSDPGGRFEVAMAAGEYEVTAVTRDGLVSPTVRAAVPGEELLLVLSPGGSIRGTVLGLDGLPAFGALVEVRAAAGGARFRRFFTDRDGGFDSGSLPPGTYEVVAHLREAEARETVRVVAGEETLVPLELMGVGVLRVVVTDPDGSPIAGAEVVLTDPMGREVAMDSPELRRRFEVERRARPGTTWDAFERERRSTSRVGRLVFEGLTAGRHTLEVLAEGYEPGAAEAEVPPNGVAEARVTLRRR